MKNCNRTLVAISLVLVAALLAGMTGCAWGGAEYKVAPVKGKVTAKGEAVKGGSVNLQPMEVAGAKTGSLGKPASGEVKEDGTFVLSTYGKEDGAVVGKHRVTYMPVLQGAKSYEDKPAPSPYAGLKAKPDQVEIKSGPNEIAIELAP